jgi:hypothetical protein
MKDEAGRELGGVWASRRTIGGLGGCLIRWRWAPGDNGARASDSWTRAAGAAGTNISWPDGDIKKPSVLRRDIETTSCNCFVLSARIMLCRHELCGCATVFCLTHCTPFSSSSPRSRFAWRPRPPGMNPLSFPSDIDRPSKLLACLVQRHPKSGVGGRSRRRSLFPLR